MPQIVLDDRTGLPPRNTENGTYTDPYGSTVEISTDPKTGVQTVTKTYVHDGRTFKDIREVTYNQDGSYSVRQDGGNGNIYTTSYNASGKVTTATTQSPAGTYTQTNNPDGTKTVTDHAGNVINGDRLADLNSKINGGYLGLPLDQSFKALGGAAAGAVDKTAGDALRGAAEGAGGLFRDIVGSLGLDQGSKIDTGAISAAADYSRGLADQYNTAYQNYQPLTAPTATSGYAQAIDPIQAAIAQHVAPIQAERAQQVGPIQAGYANAGYASPVALDPAALADAQAKIAARTMNAAQADRTQLGPVYEAEAAKIAMDQQAQFRAKQMGLVGGLEGAIAGTDPSVAAIMLRMATDRNIANQYGMAQAAPGSPMLAMRNAMVNAGDLNQQAIGQQALVRAQEIMDARKALAGVLESGRGADVALATNQAGFQNATNLANANAYNTSTLTQGQMDAQRALQNAQMWNTVGTANADRWLAADTTNATLAQQVELANQAARNTTNIAQGQLSNATNIANAGFDTQAAIANANNVTGANTATAQLANAVNIANANNTTGANTATAQLNNAVNLANANNQTQANLTTGQLTNATNIANANNATSTNIANAGNQVTTAGQNITAQNNLANNALTASGQVITGTVGAADAQAKAAAADAQAKAALIGAVGGGLATFLK